MLAGNVVDDKPVSTTEKDFRDGTDAMSNNGSAADNEVAEDVEQSDSNVSKAAMDPLADSKPGEAKEEMSDIIVRKYSVSRPLSSASGVVLVLAVGATVASLGFFALCRRRRIAPYSAPQDNALEMELCEAGCCANALE